MLCRVSHKHHTCVYLQIYEEGGENTSRGIFIICTLLLLFILFSLTGSSGLFHFIINPETVNFYFLICVVYIKITATVKTLDSEIYTFSGARREYE
jgi:hypothetical protein